MCQATIIHTCILTRTRDAGKVPEFRASAGVRVPLPSSGQRSLLEGAGNTARAREAQPGFQAQGGPLPPQGEVLAALKGRETVAQPAARCEAHPGRTRAEVFQEEQESIVGESSGGRRSPGRDTESPAGAAGFSPNPGLILA